MSNFFVFLLSTTSPLGVADRSCDRFILLPSIILHWELKSNIQLQPCEGQQELMDSVSDDRQVRTDIDHSKTYFPCHLLGYYLRFRLYGAYVGFELLGNSLIVTFRVYTSFFSTLSLILLVQPSSRTCTINATKIANSIIEYIKKEATVWHQISGGVERAAVKSEKTIKKRRLLVKVSTERPLDSSKQITITGTWEHTDEMNKIRTVNII